MSELLPDFRVKLLSCLEPSDKWQAINETMRALVLKPDKWLLHCEKSHIGVTNCFGNEIVELSNMTRNQFYDAVMSKILKCIAN
ncbi:hypothetical protein UA38_11925 [Photobacterium kishitanii]|uniref:Uncharacterized protein n=1 Tax=Photobacterium kishitanii TaxID=318456 RepID=A0AAX0YRB6_9GAMM|nr:hypothetical protein [Photobacterium kishitanii]KJG57076.1 hypothetical protein UA38_11925 [Photobacterium kishitanii]KJG60603.1 hypothetical protein UA42_14725 [Photobacterium kishitanii]KJG64905.1 hypothetical protein UA40_14420 [Photobacterium kishitanii]KJG68541.1 hypothetical protein UA41_16830 [Photobacterium kishitanii]OBU31434.1 hypothetical protein AYY23_19420 [Photobacterium kishitanii]